MDNKLVTIIVPVYNVEKYLSKCLDSIVNQTYSNLEIILVDDGSKDNSGNICDYYAKNDVRIKTVHIDNAGVSNARNIGLNLSLGDFILFLDSDDYVELDMVEQMINIFNKYNVDIVMCNFYWEYNGALKRNKISNTSFIIDSRNFINSISSENSYGGYLWNKMYKREILFNNQKLIQFDTNVLIMEDFLFNCELYDNIKKVACLDNCFNYYVQRKTSALGNRSLNKDKNALCSIIRIINFLEKNNFNINLYYKLRFIIESSYIRYKDIQYFNKILKGYFKKYFSLSTFFSYGFFKLKIKALILVLFPKIYFKIKGW